MAVRLSANPKDSKRQPNGEYPGDHRQQDCEDAEASRKMTEEGGLPQEKNRLPG